ncbi:MAG: TVP38/TMEM64 family protein [Roseibacillus sp.]|nr:TVP38/TMEM64 family protein [Roseibacillus sp.]
MKLKSPRTLVLLSLITGAVLIGWLGGLFGKLSNWMKNLLVPFLESIERLDPLLTTIAFAGLYIAATVLFVPGLLITMAAGVLFGPFKGTVIVSIASVTGASLAFLIGRYLAREWITRKTEDSPRFQAIDEAIGREGGRIVFLLRLSPLFPYNLLNYGLGLTQVRFGSYFIASWVGMLPGTFMYVYLGSLASSIASLASGTGDGKSTSQWTLYGIGLLATIIVTVLVTRIARKALNSELTGPPPTRGVNPGS